MLNVEPVVNDLSDRCPARNSCTARLIPKQWPLLALRALLMIGHSIAAMGLRIPLLKLQSPPHRPHGFTRRNRASDPSASVSSLSERPPKSKLGNWKPSVLRKLSICSVLFAV